jgi:sugar/nucleoside kinase (ribokinase family)
MIDVLTVPDMCVGLVLTGNVCPQFRQVDQIIGNNSVEPDGSANTLASQLAKRRARVGLIGWEGDDALGEFCPQRLKSLTVNTSWVTVHPQLETGLGVALAESDYRAILTYLGTNDAT